MARKTAFVNEMILQSLKQNQQVVSPILKTMTKLDDKIKEVLDDNSLNEHSKVQKIFPGTAAIHEYTGKSSHY